MQERYLFRGKRLDNGEWAVGTLRLCEGWYGEEAAEIEVNNRLHRVNISTLGQCTGLRDMKGKLIFEGDVIKNCRTGAASHSRITWNYDCWGRFDEYGYHGLHMREVEIIGNIHDNPEMLKAS